MSLKITDINFLNFRSYESFSQNGVGNLTIFVGPNAIGKTNIIEGVQLLTSLSSFRRSRAVDLIKNGQDFSNISIEICDKNRQLQIKLSLENGKKNYFLNGKKKRISELKGLIPSVIFTPDDLNLIKGSNSIRRASIDELGSQLNANYYKIQLDYAKIMRHKNTLLKDGASADLLASIDEMLIKVGAQLTNYRRALFAKLLTHIKTLYGEITGSSDVIDGRYIASWELVLDDDSLSQGDLSVEDSRELMAAALDKVRDQEIARKRMLVGPNRDEIEITIDGLDSANFASQGQQRSLVLAWKLAEAQLIRDMLDQQPILLLDDVMSELDETRRAALVKYLSDDTQTFITTANLNYFDSDMLNRANVIELPIA